MPNLGDSVNRYVIEAVLGEGGMGRVYRALDPRLGRRVALKVLLVPEGATERARADAAARLLREASAAAAFNHPNVVAIHDVGEVGGNPYIAMELVAGNTLRAYVGDAQLTTAQKLVWLLDVARGLGAAHRAGLVHRDIKPDNVMVTTDGVVKILDFGIARRSDDVVDPSSATSAANLPSLTAEGMMIGTVQYMAPEQLQGAPLDGRCDQFAWGVMAWELFAGMLPWGSGKAGAQLVAAVLATPARPLRDVVPAVEEGVSEAIARALAKSRDARFPNMEALLAALEGKRAVPAPTPSSKDVALEATAAQPSLPDGSAAPVAIVTRPSQRPPPAAVTPGVARLTTGSAAVVAQTPPPPKTTPLARGKRARAKVMAGLAVVVAGGVTLAAIARRPRVIACADVEEKAKDGPVCMAPLPAEAATKRRNTWELTEVGGHVQSMARVNFAGVTLDDDDNGRNMGRLTQVVRADDGSVKEIVVRDSHGGVIERMEWSDGGRRVDWVEEDGKTPRHADDRARVTSERLELDAHGLVIHETFHGPTGRPRPTNEGSYGDASVRGKGGHVIKNTNLAADGNPGADTGGVGGFTCDDDGARPHEFRTLDAEGHPMNNSFGVGHLHWDFDDQLEDKSLTNFGLHDDPAVIVGLGTHGIVWNWDRGKRVLLVSFVDERGRLRPSKGEASATERFTFDERGRATLHESLDENGNRVMHRHNVAADRSSYDDHDDQVRFEELDPSGAPMANDKGYARNEITYDAKGYPLEIHYFDETGHPVRRKDRGPVYRMTYDERELLTSEAFFDPDGHPVTNEHGFASRRNKYDRLRNLVEEAYFGADGHPCVTEEGISVKRSTYDENDDLVGVSYFDAAGAPTIYQGEYAAKRFKNDERGLAVLEEYLDAHGDLTLRKEEYAAVQTTRDRNGDPIVETYLGTKGQPVLRVDGYGTRKTTYDVRRRPIELTFHDAAGALVATTAGFAIERRTYDDRGLLVRRDHLSATRQPVLTTDGSSSDTTEYDARGNVTEETTLGVNGKPIASKQGYATKKSSYDDRDELVEEALLGGDGKPALGKDGWSIRRLRYDESGNLIEEAFFDGDHKPALMKDATYASSRSRYDARQRLLETSYLDASGVPAKGPEGAAALRYKRDAYGRAIEVAYFDGTGAPAASNDGKIVTRVSYDDAGHPIEELDLDASGAALVAKDGCASHRSKYDGFGRKVEEECFDAKGALTVGGDGWAIQRTLHDPRGNAVDQATYGADGKLHADATGVARRRTRFDERDLPLETRFLGLDDKPVRDRRGVHVTRFAYDETGKKTGEIYLDDHGKAVAIEEKAANK